MRFLKDLFYLFLFILLVIGGIGFWAFLIEPDQLFVRDYEVKVKNWSPKLNGFKIAAITDIHGGSRFIDKAKIREIVEKTNEQNADLIVLLGDYVAKQKTGSLAIKMPLEALGENLRGLKAKYGVYAIIGNQDNDYSHEQVTNELEKLGYVVVENKLAEIDVNGETLRILGVPDIQTDNNPQIYLAGVRAAIAKMSPKEGKIIALTHNPDAIVYLTDDFLISPELVLLIAGHTHGGQVNLPIIGSPFVPSMYGQKYRAGHIRDRGIDIFVSSGIGTSVVPVRFNVPPEISILRINSEE